MGEDESCSPMANFFRLLPVVANLEAYSTPASCCDSKRQAIRPRSGVAQSRQPSVCHETAVLSRSVLPGPVKPKAELRADCDQFRTH